MIKIGIYLQSGPACGGTYQYNRMMLDALCDLPQTHFEIVAIYGSQHWENILEAKQLKRIYVPLTPLAQKLTGIWRRSHLPLSFWRKIARFIHPLAKAMVKENCRHWIFPSQDALAYWMPVSAIATVHDLMHRYERRFPEVGAASEFNIREFHYQNTCRWASKVLVDSELGKQQLMESYAVHQDRCHVLPFVAPKNIESVQALEFDQKYTLPKKFLFYPAQFWEHKNHDRLLLALYQLLPKLPDLQLVLVGSPKNHYESIIDLIQRLKLKDVVHLLGLVEDDEIPELYRRARALIMPTFFGPTNIPPLEAFALGCPVGISGIYVMKEQLQEAALYFDPNSIDEIADVIQKLWTDDALCQQLIALGKQRTSELNFEHFKQNVHSILI